MALSGFMGCYGVTANHDHAARRGLGGSDLVSDPPGSPLSHAWPVLGRCCCCRCHSWSLARTGGQNRSSDGHCLSASFAVAVCMHCAVHQGIARGHGQYAYRARCTTPEPTSGHA